MAMTMRRVQSSGRVQAAGVGGRIAAPSMQQLMATSGGGSSMASAVSVAAGEASNFYQQKQMEQKKADDTAFVMERVTEFEDDLRIKQNEFLSLKGKNAQGSYQGAVEYADSSTSQYTQDIEDPNLKAVVIDQISARRKNFLNTIATHDRNERTAHIQNVQVSRVKGLSEDFISAATPEDEEEVIRNLSLTVKALGAAQGKTNEEVETNLAGQMSSVLSSKVISIAASDPNSAISYYKGHEEMILPSERAGILSRLEGKTAEIARKSEAARNNKRAELLAGVGDANAYMYETGDSSAMNNISAGLRSMGLNDEADDVDLQVRAGSIAYEIVQRSGDKSFTERLSEVSTAFPITAVENAEDIAKARDMATKTLQSQVAAFRKAPADYVDQDLPQELTGEERITARLERIEQIGKGLKFERSLLTTAEKESLTKKLTEAEDPSDKLYILSGIDRAYGKYSAKIFDDMGFPAATFAAIDILDKSYKAEPDAKLLITATMSDPKDIPQRSDLKAASIQTAVEGSAVYGMYSDLAQLTGADEVMQGSVRSVQDTLGNVVRITGDTNSAQILDKYYGVLNDDDYKLTFDKVSIDDGMLEDVLDATKAARRESVVRAIGDEAPTMMQKFFGASYDSNVVWIDAQDGNGWVMLAKNSQTIVTDADGEMIRVTPDDIREDNKFLMQSRGETGTDVTPSTPGFGAGGM